MKESFHKSTDYLWTFVLKVKDYIGAVIGVDPKCDPNKVDLKQNIICYRGAGCVESIVLVNNFLTPSVGANL